MSFKSWKDIPVPIHTSFYFYHVENPYEIIYYGKPAENFRCHLLTYYFRCHLLFSGKVGKITHPGSITVSLFGPGWGWLLTGQLLSIDFGSFKSGESYVKFGAQVLRGEFHYQADDRQ
jgi:hypothetical protein